MRQHPNWVENYGRYSFRATVPAGGGLRPLRDPVGADDGEDDEQ
ncbi:hypothetical protein [Streptomyces sp. NPDC059631]